MSNAASNVERMLIPHAAFVDARRRIEQCYAFAVAKREAEGLAIVGESGTGKTSVLTNFREKYPPKRGSDGMEVPVLCASVPSAPTVKSLAGVMLAALGAPDCERGTENEKSRRLRVLMKTTGTRMVMIDEFQHFYDRGTRRIMHHVADWLKLLIDDTRSTLVVAGLPSCTAVIDQNEQLARRFLGPVQLTRFQWNDAEHRGQFSGILKAYYKEIAQEYDLPDLSSEQMAFRVYLATGGLMGYLAKLLRQALRNIAVEDRRSLTLEDLNTAHLQAIWSRQRLADLPKPFERGFKPEQTVDVLNRVSRIGTVIEPSPMSGRRKAGKQIRESINSMLVTR
jgi:hypothetical protein